MTKKLLFKHFLSGLTLTKSLIFITQRAKYAYEYFGLKAELTCFTTQKSVAE
jgi:hypothetical protein